MLKNVGFQIQVASPDIDESRLPKENPKAMVGRLAREKAEALAYVSFQKYGEAILIAADTTVVAPDGKTVLGKPRDEKEAQAMLRKLSGRTHLVHTGYCVLGVKKDGKVRGIVRAVTSKVTMRKMDASTIRGYVKTGEPMDKAGSYGAQGIGMALIEKIAGSYSNVVGLPMSQLLEDLEKEFGIRPFPGK